VLLLAFEFGVARQDWIWDFVLASPTGIITALEGQVIDGSDPRIVVMGSSRVRDGVSPRQLEQKLNLKEGTVLNLAVTNGSCFDALTIYRRNREVLSRARLLVVGIEDRTFNASWPPNDRDRRYMTLRERVDRWSAEEGIHGPYDGPHTLSLIVGWFWRTYDARGPLLTALKSTIKGRDATLPIADDGRVKWREDEVETGPEKLKDSSAHERFYRDWKHTEQRKAFLEELIELARQDNVEVLVIKLPWRTEHLALIQEHHPGPFSQYRASAAQFQGAQVVLWDDPDALGMPDHHFYDYGHPTTLGAKTITTALAIEIRTKYPHTLD
jgi:hypothetical protein